MKVKTIALVFAACAAVAATTSAFAGSPVDTSANDQAVGQASQWATVAKSPKGKRAPRFARNWCRQSMTVSLRRSTSSIEAVDCLLPMRCRFSASPFTYPVQHGTDHAVSVPGVDADDL